MEDEVHWERVSRKDHEIQNYFEFLMFHKNEHKICSGGARWDVNVRPRGRVNVVEKEAISSQGRSCGRSHRSSWQ